MTFRYGFAVSDVASAEATGTAVIPQVLERLPATHLLAVTALVFAFTVAVVLGCLAATRPRSILDRAVNLVSLAGVSIVDFWLGFLLIMVFSVQWGGPVFARVSRGLALSLRENTFIQATRSIGATDAHILLKHMLPNMASPLMVLFTLEVAVLILAEAALSFLGFGIQPPGSSWGLMIARGREYLGSA